MISHLLIQIIAGVSVGILSLALVDCKPASESSRKNLTQILPLATVQHMLPTGNNGRVIPVNVIHFRKIDEEGNIISNQTEPELLPNSLMAPRGFRDEFDMKFASVFQRRKKTLETRMEAQVPIIPPDATTPNWVPGELIMSEATRRQIKMLDHSRFGPIQTVTFVPSVRAAIIVFEKRYHPEKLAQALKYLYGIDSEPNGVITTTE